MCGIFGYIGKRQAIRMAIEGLKRLEYRGYDSSGVAYVEERGIVVIKQEGKVEALEKVLSEASINSASQLALAHTRWATHGPPSKRNAHPHQDTASSLALVHNGIIENQQVLRQQLIEKGITFLSDTDTEVVAHLIAYHYHGDILKAMQEVLKQLEGTFALALLHRDYPGQIIACAHHAPLAVGLGSNEAFISSDTRAFSVYTRDVLYLADREIAIIHPTKLELFAANLAPLQRPLTSLSHCETITDKGDYEHYTLKEIYEQPQTLRQAMHCRYIEDHGSACFEELAFSASELLTVQRLLIVACGTSWHAGCLATYLFEDLAHLPTQVEIASEFRYRNSIIPTGTLAIVISQSGETADTVAAMRELKAKNIPILALCNVEESTLARESDGTLFLRAGVEIGVCSTKAFTSQVAVLTLFALLMARLRYLPIAQGQAFLQELRQLPLQVASVLTLAPKIEALASKYCSYDNFFFLGRRYMYPTSLEGALKLKEISYINANAYAAGEMKHGPIALINEECPSIALCNNRHTYSKILSNLMEVKARKGPLLVIGDESCHGLANIADDTLLLPCVRDELAPITVSVALQLFAYYVAKERGADIDHPRNLAKSVTVE